MSRAEQSRAAQRDSAGRTVGLDLYRIMAMLMITVLHIVYQHYGLLNGKHPQSTFLFGLFLEYAGHYGVNSFALLTGFLLGERFVGYNKSLLLRFFSLYIKVIIWGTLIYLVSFLFLPLEKFSVRYILNCFFPFCVCWWYIKAYFGLLVFLPVITCFTRKSSSCELMNFSCLLVIVCCIFPYFSCTTPILGIQGGFSSVWLVICFILGAMIRKNIAICYSWKYCRLVALFLSIFCILVPYFLYLIVPALGSQFLHTYISPFYVCGSMALLLFFYGIKIKNSWLLKIISFASINALGIYLFQCHSIVMEKLICQNNPEILPFHTYLWAIPAWIIGLAVIGILLNWIIDSLIRLCRIVELGMWVFDWSFAVVRRLFQKLTIGQNGIR